MKLTLTCISCLLLLMMMIGSCEGDNKTAFRAILPDWLKNILDFFRRLDELTKSAELDGIIRDFGNEISNGGQGLLPELGKCLVDGILTYMLENQGTALGKMAVALGLTATTKESLETNPSSILVMLLPNIPKLGAIDFTGVWSEFKPMLLDTVPRVCARGPLNADIDGFKKVLKMITDLGVPWETQPGEE